MNAESEILAESQAYLDALDKRDRHRWAVRYVEADLRRRARAHPKPSPRPKTPPARAILCDLAAKTLSLARREYAGPIAALERRVARLELFK
jgi:hypothetical protein